MQEEQDTESGHELKMLNFPEHFTFFTFCPFWLKVKRLIFTFETTNESPSGWNKSWQFQFLQTTDMLKLHIYFSEDSFVPLLDGIVVILDRKWGIAKRHDIQQRATGQRLYTVRMLTRFATMEPWSFTFLLVYVS